MKEDPKEGWKYRTKSQIDEYVDEFLRQCDACEGRRTHEGFKETHGWKYVLKCLESVRNRDEEEPDVKELDKYEAFCYVLNKHEIFSQVVAAVDRQRAGEKDSMPLFGLPMAVKDNLAVKNVPFTNGATSGPFRSTYNANSVKRMLEAGAIVVGKTKLNGFGVGTNTNTVINPLGDQYIVGGSSGGSGAAVGGNCVTCALGTDTGGSVRLPSAFANCVGYRPSMGAISKAGMSEMAARFDTVGFMTNTVYQAAYLAYLTLGFDLRDMYSRLEANDLREAIFGVINKMDHPKRGLNEGRPLEGVKIGIFDHEEIHKLGYVDAENRRNMENVERVAKSLGAEIVKVEVLPLETYASLYYLYTAKQLATNMRRFNRYPYTPNDYEDLKDFVQNLDPRITERFLLGEYVKAVGLDIERLLKDLKRELIKWLERYGIFTDVEFIITPATSEVLPRKSIEFQSKNMYMLDMFLSMASVLGVSSLVVPMRNSQRPNCFQIMAGYLQDHRLFEVAHIFEQNLNMLQ